MIYDAIVIGGGVVGCSALRYLSAYAGNYLLLEKEAEVATGASAANSGIVHTGYDCEPGTNKARFNVAGANRMEEVCRALHVSYQKTGSLVVGREQDLPELQKLLSQGEQNGVKNLRILEREEFLRIQPDVNASYRYALYSPDTAIVSPYNLTIAYAESAIVNGSAVLTGAEVTAVERKDDLFRLHTKRGEFVARYLINAAGANCAAVNDLASGEPFTVTYRKGEYYVADKQQPGKEQVKTVVYPCPNEMGKGILVVPTTAGNLLYGPTAENIQNYETEVSRQGLSAVRTATSSLIDGLKFNGTIRVFAGVRVLSGHDFIVKEDERVPGLFTFGGICSPGLSASPALGEEAALCAARYLKKEKKKEVLPLPPRVRVKDLTEEEKNALIRKDPRYGKVVCRCETVTEGEILAELSRPLPPKTLDGFKRRLRTGMGRCQGGFCWPRMAELLTENGVPLAEITKAGAGTEIVVSEIKAGIPAQTNFADDKKQPADSVKTDSVKSAKSARKEGADL